MPSLRTSMTSSASFSPGPATSTLPFAAPPPHILPLPIMPSPLTPRRRTPSSAPITSPTPSPSLPFDENPLVAMALLFDEMPLHCLRPGDSLPTLLRNRTICVTGVQRSNFTLEDTRVTYPDVFNKDAISTHGIGGVLNYKRYGSAAPSLEGLEQGNASLPSPLAATTAVIVKTNKNK